MQAVLVMFRNDGERRSFSISREVTVIGRRQDCDLMIPLGEISRKHCRIIREGDTLRLEDLGSSNGTFHNGKRIQEVMLDAGDTVTVGPVSFVVQIDGVPAEDEMKPHTGGAGAMAGDDDELETLPDDEELGDGPSPEISAGSGKHELEMESDELEPLGEDVKLGGDEEELEVLSEDSGGGGHELDAEIEENIQLDEEDKLETLNDSGAADVTLEDEKPKRRHK
jgi:pSer/pThr/pTyr-binding forkhead associated (FHA) protein